LVGIVVCAGAENVAGNVAEIGVEIVAAMVVDSQLVGPAGRAGRIEQLYGRTFVPEQSFDVNLEPNTCPRTGVWRTGV
jgi:hypothetical protein